MAASGAALFVSTLGSGPLCLVPSAIGTRPYVAQTHPGLSRDMTLAYVDLRGCGRSTGDMSQMSFDLLAEDLEAVRQRLGTETTAVLGHSILGILAIEYSRRRPESVSHVVVAGTPPRGDMAWLAREQARFFAEDASPDRIAVLKEALAALPGDAPFSRALLAETPKRFFDPRRDLAPIFAEAEWKGAFLKRFMELVSPWDVTLGAQSLSVPILVALGRYDYVVPHTLWEGVEATIPSVTRRLFDQSGHQPFFEEPERFTQVLREWRIGLESSRPPGNP